MNSVENANGYAYVLGSMYADELDVDPVSLCAYFYYYFLHISDRAALQKVVLTNFDGVHLPDGVTSALPEDYSAEAIEEKILQGMLYYAQNEEYFDAGQFSDSGIDQWEINYEYGLGTELLDIASSIFDDVPAGSYYEKAVSWALLNGVTTGTSATTFSPKADCTRKDVVTFLYRAAGSPSVEGLENPFTDVPAGSYYEKAVKWAVANGVTTGTSATTFSPSGICTRKEVVTFLYRAAGSPSVEGLENPFEDVPAGSYYEKAVKWAVANDVTTGTSATTFTPNASCTRAQVVTFLYRAA